MRQTAPIGQADVQAAVLPARAAYLVPAGDRDSVVVAVQEASTRWAGATEPIVPVRANGRIDGWWRQVIELSSVHGLVSINLQSHVTDAVAARLGLSVVDIADIDERGSTQFSPHPNHLASSNPAGDVDSWVMASENASLWQRVALGDYYSNRVDDLSQLPITRIPESDAADEICRAQIQGNTWLDAGVRDFAEHRTIGVGDAPVTLWATKPNSLRECVHFWNLRALRSLEFARRPMVLLPMDAGLDWERLSEQLAHHLRRPDEIEPDVLLFSVNADDATLDEFATALGLVPSTVKPYSRWRFPPPPPKQPPYTYRRDIDPRIYVTFGRDYGKTVTTTVQVYRENTRVEFDSPVRFSEPGRMTLHLESDLFAGLPRRPPTAAMIHDHATWSGDKLQIASYGQDHYRLDIRAPALEDVAWKLLRDSARAELSDKGRMAQRLLELGGRDVLLDRNVRLAINALKTRRSTELAAELARLSTENPMIDDLALRLGETQQRRFQSVHQLRSAAAAQGAASAELLCQQGWAERGLSIRCDRCSVRSFVTLSQTKPQGACPACQAAQPYEVDADSGAPELHYRLHGLIDRAADQGVLSHLLAIAVLRKEHDLTFLIPGADVCLADETRREVDLFGVFNGIVVAGEAKTSPIGFEESDIEADIGLSAALGADAHLMVATEEIAGPTVQRAKQITQNASLGLILVQGEAVETVVQID